MTALENELQGHRTYLFRFALLQLRDEAAAEDVVQETLLAALESRNRGNAFGGKSSTKTWLTGILKHKIIDAIRRRTREPQLLASDTDENDDPFDVLFDHTGHWADGNPKWNDPDQSLEQKKFFEVLEACMESLPANTARVFMMREFLEFETDEICKELKLTSTNCWVILYRARMSLKLCLEKRWFGVAA